MFLPGNWIHDRLTPGFSYSWHDQTRFTLIHIDVEFDRCKHWIVDFLQRCGENLENRRPRLSVLARYDSQQLFTLYRRRPFVNNNGRFAFTFVDGTRPVKYPHEPES